MSIDIDMCEIVIFLTRLKTDIESDLKPTLNRGDPEGGYWSTIQLIFTYTELFGAYYLDLEPSTNTGMEFIKKYFKIQNPLYSNIPGLLYTICRHGTVHQRKVKKFIIIDKQGNKHPFGIVVGKDIDLVNRSDSSNFYWSKEHGGDGQFYSHFILKCPEKSHEISKKYSGIKLLPISIEQLYFDFNKAIENYLTELKRDKTLQDKAIQMKDKMNDFSKFLSINSTIYEEHQMFQNRQNRKGRKKRNYINQSELEYILNLN